MDTKTLKYMKEKVRQCEKIQEEIEHISRVLKRIIDVGYSNLDYMHFITKAGGTICLELTNFSLKQALREEIVLILNKEIERLKEEFAEL